MHPIADGVWQLSGLIPHLINAYLIATPEGDVLVDTGTCWTTSRLLRALRGRKLALVTLTHVDPAHQGAAADVCRRHRVPLACHADDADVMEGKRGMQPTTVIVRLGHHLLSGPPHPVAIRWQGGEQLGDWQVIHAP